LGDLSADLRLSADGHHVFIWHRHVIAIHSIATNRRGVIFSIQLTINIINCWWNTTESEESTRVEAGGESRGENNR
jgi:hypothetical protein